jgi:hypothetical protein
VEVLTRESRRSWTLEHKREIVGRGEADALATLAGAAVAQLHPLHLNRANAGLNQALRAMTVPNQTLTPVRQLHALYFGQERVGFCFDGLRQKRAGAVSQNRRQRIVDLVVLTKESNSAIAHRGVSLLREVQAGFVTRLDTPPFSRGHHPGSAIALCIGVFAEAPAYLMRPLVSVALTFLPLALISKQRTPS